MLQIHDEARGAFARALRRIRVDYRITQSVLADECGIPRTSLSNYERSKTIPTTDTLDKIIITMYGHDIDESDEDRLRRAWTQAVKASNNRTIGRVI